MKSIPIVDLPQDVPVIQMWTSMSKHPVVM